MDKVQNMTDKRPDIRLSQLSVKLGQIIFTNDPERYNLLGIGTCLGIYMYNLGKSQYMMAHTVLPEYDGFQCNCQELGNTA